MELRAETSMLNDDKLRNDIEDSQTVADNSYNAVSNLNQYFWFNPTGEDTGGHVSFIAKDTFEDTQTGYNALVSADMIALRYGLLAMAVLNADSLDFYKVDTLANRNVKVASFGATTTIGDETDATVPYVTLDTEGMTVHKGDQDVAKFSDTARIGNQNGFHINVVANADTGEVAFWAGPENLEANKVAYVSGQELYITQTVVLNQMNIGTTKEDNGDGQWAWRVHEVNGSNNLYLKWLG